MTMLVTLRGPADPDQFRIKVGRFKERWYHDTLPGCEVAPACEDVYPSASLVKGAWPKFLHYWAAREAATCAVTERGNWQGMTESAAIDYIAKAHERSRDKAADRGSLVHKLLEDLIAGQPVDPLLEVEVQPWMNAARRFVEECHPEIILSEAVVISRVLGVGGTADAGLRINGRDYFVDYKTRGLNPDGVGKHDVYDDEAAQLGFYTQPDTYIIVDEGGRAVRRPLPKFDGGLIITIAPDGYRLHPVDLDVAGELARSLYGFWDAKRTSPVGKPVMLATHPASAPAGDLQQQLAAQVQAMSVERQMALSIELARRGLPRLSETPAERLGEWAEAIAAIDAPPPDRDLLRQRVLALTVGRTDRLTSALQARGLAGITATPDERLVEWEQLLAEVEAWPDPFDEPDESVAVEPAPPATMTVSGFAGALERSAAIAADAAGKSDTSGLRARVEALPHDLAAEVDAARAGTILEGRNLLHGGTPEEVALAEQLVADAEARHAERIACLTGLLADCDDDMRAVLLDGVPPERATDFDVKRLTAVTAAIDALAVAFTYSEHGKPVLTCTDRALEVLTKVHGNRATVLAVGREVARSLGRPSLRSAAEVAADPIVTALTLNLTINQAKENPTP